MLKQKCAIGAFLSVAEGIGKRLMDLSGDMPVKYEGKRIRSSKKFRRLTEK